MRSLFTLIVVFGAMIAEARRAAHNERVQRRSGGLEPPGDVYRVMRVAYPAAFLLMIIEGAARGGASSSWFLIGALLFALAKTLKWWAILTLGQRWTFRVIVVPGDTRIAAGPYRVLRHPNYLAVVMELAGVAVMTGARLTGPIGVLAFGALILRRIKVEDHALGAILRPS